MVDNPKSKPRKWSERDTIRFVELYEAEEVLWNIRLENYKNKDARESAIQRIIQNMGLADLTSAEVTKKINSIRGTYNQEKLKEKKSARTGSGVDDVYVSSLPWYDVAERFLSGVIKGRKTIEPDSQDTLKRNELDPIVSLSSASSDVFESICVDVSPTDIIPPPPQYNSILNDNDILATAPSPTNKKRKKNQIPLHIEKSIETLQSIKNQVLQNKENKENEDEFAHFGKNIASQLRRLPIIEALDAQSEILDLLRKKRQSIQHIQEQNSHSLFNSPQQSQSRQDLERMDHDYPLPNSGVPEHVFNSPQQSQSRQDLNVQMEHNYTLPNIDSSEHAFDSQHYNTIDLTTDLEEDKKRMHHKKQ